MALIGHFISTVFIWQHKERQVDQRHKNKCKEILVLNVFPGKIQILSGEEEHELKANI